MASQQMLAFQECFERVADPRVVGRSAHPLQSILFLVVSAIISGCDDLVDVESFGVERRAWLERFCEFPAGIPSHDTLGRVLSMIKPAQFQQALLDWVVKLRGSIDSDGPIVVAIDGKTSCGSYTKKDKSDAVHLVSAWATEFGVSLGQVAVDSKSNEITAIPQVLEMLDLRGTIITMDAMGCQTAIAKQIIQGGGDYTISLKNNQPKLFKAVENVFLEAYEAGLVESGFRSSNENDKGHGRTEVRSYVVAKIPADIQALAKKWPGIKSIGQATTYVVTDGKETCEVRYFISSRPPRVNEFANSVRKHWQIESMHWILDVAFREDASRIRTGNAVANMSIARKFVITLLKQDTSRSSLKVKRKKASWNTTFLEKCLFGRTF